MPLALCFLLRIVLAIWDSSFLFIYLFIFQTIGCFLTVAYKIDVVSGYQCRERKRIEYIGVFVLCHETFVLVVFINTHIFVE